MAVPIEIPATVLDRLVISPTKLADWRRDYGIDFTPLAELARNSQLNLNEKHAAVANWKSLAEPQLVSDFDLSRTLHEQRDVTAQFEITRDGRIDGLILWFAATLAKNNVLSTDPRAPRPDNHWRHPVYFLARPLAVRPGCTVNMWIEGGGSRSARVEIVDSHA